jgi:tetratricopeptide (TPR) repeat protein
VNQIAEAMQCFAAEVERHPDHEDAARELGLSLARLGDHARAVAQLERLARRHPDQGRNWHALGFAHRAAKRPRDAEAALRRAIRLPPEDAEEHRDLGALLAELGREREARAEYARAAALAPGDASVWLNLGNLERRAGRIDSALVCYARAEARDTVFSLAYRGQVQLLRERNRLTEAGDVYRRWLARCPEEHGTRLDAIAFFTSLGRRDLALEIARDGVDRVRDSGQPLVLYGMTLAGQGRTREGLSHLRQADRLFKTNPPERERVRTLIASLRAAAPDSLRAMFQADSVAHAQDR